VLHETKLKMIIWNAYRQRLRKTNATNKEDKIQETTRKNIKEDSKRTERKKYQKNTSMKKEERKVTKTDESSPKEQNER